MYDNAKPSTENSLDINLPLNDGKSNEQESMELHKLQNEQKKLLQHVHDKVTTLLRMTQDVLREVDTSFSSKLRKITRKPLLDLLPRIR